MTRCHRTLDDDGSHEEIKKKTDEKNGDQNSREEKLENVPIVVFPLTKKIR